MSSPNIPNITPSISISREQAINLTLTSIALEELGLAHIVNAEAEKIQFVLGTLSPKLGQTITFSPTFVTLTNLLNLNASVRRTLQDVIKKEMLLEFKFENILELLPITIAAAPCGCQATNNSGNNFNINRGNNAGNTTVVFNGMTLPSNGHGSVTYNGHICQTCTSNNEFTFDYGGSGGPPTVPAFIFTADTFTVPRCPENVVTITGQGTTNNTTLFGNNPATYTLTLNGATGSISLTILGSNGNTFTATATNLGGGQLVVTDCP